MHKEQVNDFAALLHNKSGLKTQHQTTGTEQDSFHGEPIIDTTELAAKVRHYLKFNEIQWGRFSSLVLGVGQSRLSTLLGKPQPWHLLNRRLQIYYERMQLWMDTRATYGNNPYQRKVKAVGNDKKPRGRQGRTSGGSVASKKKPRSLFDLEENSGQMKIKLKFNNLKRGSNVVDHVGKSEIGNNNNDVSKNPDVCEGKNDVKVHSIPESSSLVLNYVVVQADPLELDNVNTKVKTESKLLESQEVTQMVNVNEVIPTATVKEEVLSDDEIEMEFLDTEMDLFEESASNKKDSTSASALDTVDTKKVLCNKEGKKDDADKLSFFSFLDKKHKETTKDNQVNEEDLILGY